MRSGPLWVSFVLLLTSPGFLGNAEIIPKIMRGKKYDARISSQITGPGEGFDVIEIRTKDGKDISKLDLSQVGGSKRGVYKQQWTRTGDFFVVSTSSPHSTWHLRTFVFGARTKRFIELDGYLRPVVGDFRITENQLIVAIQNGVGLGTAPPLHVRVNLAELENVAANTKPLQK
jgi:hypothetical protein